MIGAWDRVPDHRYGEAIACAYAVMPSAIRLRLASVRFLCGVDPRFAGLHAYGDTTDGRSYGVTAHCCYPFNVKRPRAERATTIVLPEPEPPVVIVHELGHAFDGCIGFEHEADPVTTYAETNRYEAFAEAFTAWLYPDYGDQDRLHADRPTISLFEELAA